MAKKSNKTEQVLKLITKDGVGEEEEMEEVEEEEVEEMEATEEIEEVQPEPEPEPAPVPEPEPAPTPAPEPAHSPMDFVPDNIFEEDEDIYLVNLTEMLVKEKVVEIMKKLNVCLCPKCRYDVLALTLNSLTNKFVTSNTGRLHIQLEVYKKQSETDIVAALTRASVRVKSSPYHE